MTDFKELAFCMGVEAGVTVGADPRRRAACRKAAVILNRLADSRDEARELLQLASEGHEDVLGDVLNLLARLLELDE